MSSMAMSVNGVSRGYQTQGEVRGKKSKRGGAGSKIKKHCVGPYLESNDQRLKKVKTHTHPSKGYQSTYSMHSSIALSLRTHRL